LIDLFSLLFGTLKAATYFAATLSGFKDSQGRFKVFDGDEAPTTETPFITVEILSTPQGQRTNWHAPQVIFHVAGDDVEVGFLWQIANKIRDTFSAATKFSDGTQYQLIGDATYSEGWNPVTEHRVVSLALQFGLAE
jgi:hypothetical protein